MKYRLEALPNAKGFVLCNLEHQPQLDVWDFEAGLLDRAVRIQELFYG
jgi:hypothetical protein